jgi:hypothetical protein
VTWAKYAVSGEFIQEIVMNFCTANLLLGIGPFTIFGGLFIGKFV